MIKLSAQALMLWLPLSVYYVAVEKRDRAKAEKAS